MTEGTVNLSMRFHNVKGEQYVRVTDVVVYLEALASKLEDANVPGGAEGLRAAGREVSKASVLAPENPA